MEALQYLCKQINHSRDIVNYMTLRDAQEADDQQVGDFLLKVFSLAHCIHTRETPVQPARIEEILAVSHRRKNGVVRILELGRKIVGSYGLVRPGKNSGAWNQNASYFCAFAIDTNMQGLGLAALLIADAQLTSLAWDLPVMDFKVVKFSKKLHYFYQKLGFRPDPFGDCREHEVDLLGFSGPLSHSRPFEILQYLNPMDRKVC